VAKPTRRPKSNGTTRPSIERRTLSFDVDGEPAGRWHRNNPYVSHFFNGLSLMFPEGERFFMRSVARVRTQVRDPQLQRAITAFLAQEGMHSREHVKYNRALRRQGYPTRLLELVTRVALRSTEVMSARWQLAVTCGFEHFTATLADTVLRDQAILEGAEPEFAALWRWHCAEEIEHKSVAFDVYEELAPGLIGYLRRVIIMLFLTANFLPYSMVHQIVLASGDRIVPHPREVARAVQFFWTRPGLVPRGLRLYLDYFRPGFQPWDHDNTDSLARWRRDYAPTA
jgi:predicted metal-dependent hydrolase